MRILKKWQSQLHNYFLQKKLPTHLVKRQPKGFEDAKTFGILFDATEPEHRQAIKRYVQFLKQQGKQVKVLAFLNENQKQENFTFKHFSRKELDWVLRPLGNEVDEFINTPFDFLINICLKANQPLEYISTLSKAHTRVGPYTDKPYSFDLMIETQEQSNIQYFIKQLEYFLSRMNRKKHEEAIV